MVEGFQKRYVLSFGYSLIGSRWGNGGVKLSQWMKLSPESFTTPRPYLGPDRLVAHDVRSGVRGVVKSVNLLDCTIRSYISLIFMNLKK
jgi:hypothetical protein